ncbi:MAG TPA: glycosyltransferase, partial [Pyrinomonadaceae bacterium]
MTFQCLRSLLAEVDPMRDEIIVVDDASTDETADMLAAFGRQLTIVSNEENRGFVDSCNAGAAAARGKYIVFLNNDTVVLPRWLDALVETAEADEDVGAVGSMFLYPDGRIQEAGGIIWNDGRAFHYAWSGSARARKYSFARDVDYCSGASLLIRRDLFETLGGFDRRYAPGYYEDADLCLSVWGHGKRVVYQPASRLVHYEGGTAGTNLSSGMKRFQEINQPKFFEKWQRVLLNDHLPHTPENIELASDRGRSKSIVLVFDERLPTPDRDAGSLRMQNILRCLAKEYRVVFVPVFGPMERHEEEILWADGVRTCGMPFWRRHSVDDVRAVILSRPTVADALKGKVRRKFAHATIVYDMVDAHFVRLLREHAISGDRSLNKKLAQMKRVELAAAKRADLVWCNSAADEGALHRELPEIATVVIPTIHSSRSDVRNVSQRSGLLFIGNLEHRPNRDGLLYFLHEVLPELRLTDDRSVLTVIGVGADDEIRSHASGSVRILGHVPDVRPFIDVARVFVAPIRFGAGTKGKIGEALAAGLPVVTTSIGAEGMFLAEGENVLIADSPHDFTAAVTALCKDDELWRRISRGGLAHVESTFSPKVIGDRILS